ncbi:MAG: hypothetical protein ACJ73S_13225 [Mycobacteriales bacterium]
MRADGRLVRAAAAACLLPVLTVAACDGGGPAKERKESHACTPSATGAGRCTVRVPGLDTVTTVAATSASDLWFFALPQATGEHWDGRAWHRFPLRLPPDYAPDDVRVVGPADIWVAAQTSSRPAPTVFAHWDGRTWTDHPAAPWQLTGIPDPTRFLPAPSAAGLWATEGSDRLERWDGQNWRAVKAPGIADTGTAAPASPGAGEVWVATGTAVDHWTGTAWQRLDLPAGDWADALATGPGGDLWVSVHPDLSRHLHQLLHREGSSWRQVPVTSTLGSFDGQLTADGQGGLWLSVSPAQGTDPVANGGLAAATVDRRGLHGAVGGLVHRTAAGAVTEVAGPRPPYATLAAGAPTNEHKRLPAPWRDEIRTMLLAVVPGTGTVWFAQRHKLYSPGLEGAYNEDYSRGDLTLLQRYG